MKHHGHVSQGMVFAIDDSFPEIRRMTEELEDKGSHVEIHLKLTDLDETFNVERWRAYCEYIET